jgi:hypothetical protein
MLENAEYDKEEEKLETYNNLSSTLAKVSPESVSLFAPTVTSILQSHSKQLERMQADYRRLSSIWEDIFGTFVQRLKRTMDANLDNAIQRLHEETDAQIERIKAAASAVTLNANNGETTSSDQAYSRDAAKRKFEEERRWEERTHHRNDSAHAEYQFAHERGSEPKRTRIGSEDSKQYLSFNTVSANGASDAAQSNNAQKSPSVSGQMPSTGSTNKPNLPSGPQQTNVQQNPATPGAPNDTTPMDVDSERMVRIIIFT